MAPPVALPQILVRPPTAPPSAPSTTAVTSGGDPWDDLPDWTPQGQAQSGPSGNSAANPWAALPEWTPPQPAAGPAGAPQRNVGTGEALARGALNSVTLGAGPAIAGLEQAGQTAEAQSPTVAATAAEATPVGRTGPMPVLPPVVGAAKMLVDWATNHPDPDVQAAYNRGRTQAAQDQQLAQEQHPVAYLAGQLGGALALPGLTAMKATGTLGRVGTAAVTGGLGGGAYAAGTDVSEGTPAGEIPADVALGAGTGMVFGGGGAAAMQGAGKIARTVGNLVRGGRDVDAEAARRVVAAASSDLQSQGPAMTSQEIAGANAAGTPRAIVDAGGERTRALARSAANTSPEARQALSEFTQQRFESQSPRIAGLVRRLGGGSNATSDADLLDRAGQHINRPLYGRAYAAGDRPIWSPELERLSGSDAVQAALAGAVKRGNNRAIADKFGGFNPGAKVTPDGRVIFNRGPKGVPTYPNLQFWDYAQRELRDAENVARRAGRNEEAGALNTIGKQLRAELDRQVPEFGHARATAASFFGAGDALEAGREFVMSNKPIAEAAKALAKMTPAERELFARGFASDLADKIERTGDRRSVINSIFLGSQAARQKVMLALGANRARLLEAALRAETIVDEARKALGNSTTARQLGEMGMAGGAVATFEGLKEHEFNPVHIIAAALTFGAVRHGAKVIDEKVARRVGEMLVSNDPAILAKGVQIAAASPAIFDALRHATQSFARVGAHDVGPVNTVAGAVAGAKAIGHLFEPEDTEENPVDDNSNP